MFVATCLPVAVTMKAQRMNTMTSPSSLPTKASGVNSVTGPVLVMPWKKLTSSSLPCLGPYHGADSIAASVDQSKYDLTALAETETADIIAAAYSGIGDKGYQGSDFITPFKKPQGGELLDWQKEFNAQVNKLRAPVERAIAHLKSWRILHTDYRRPLRTYVMSYRAAVGLYFFKLNFE